MKKILIIGLFALLGIQACKKDNTLIDGKKPEDRNRESVEKYKKELTGSVNGWKAILYTNDLGGGYSFYINFKENSRVTMLADYDDETAKDVKESTYEVKQIMVPSIIFNTYNYLHLLADPDPNEFGGNQGSGYGSDFEFEIREQVGDTLKLVGKKRDTKLILVKATAADKTFFTEGGFSDLVGGINTYLKSNPFIYFLDPKDNTTRVQVFANTDADQRTVSLSVLQNNSIVSSNTTFGFSTKGMTFVKPLVYGPLTFVGTEWDQNTGKLFLVTATGTKVEILKSATPILPLHLLMGSSYSGVIVPAVNSLPGWSEAFINARAIAAAEVNRFSLGGVRLNLDRIVYSFNTSRQTLNVQVVTTYGSNGLLLTYPYSYTKTADGIYTFTAEQITDGNSNAIADALASILDPLSTDDFTLDYFVNPNNAQLLGQFKSVQTPAFTFAGPLQ